jgi:hypothetical protein
VIASSRYVPGDAPLCFPAVYSVVFGHFKHSKDSLIPKNSFARDRCAIDLIRPFDLSSIASISIDRTSRCSMASGQLPALSADSDDLLSHAIVTCTSSRHLVAYPFPCFHYNVAHFLYLPQLGVFHMYYGLFLTPTLVTPVLSPSKRL